MNSEEYKILVTKKSIVLKGDTQFGKIASDGNLHKLYIIKSESEFLCIGATKQKMYSKFSQTYTEFKKIRVANPNIKCKYDGYNWVIKNINSDKELDLFVFSLKRFKFSKEFTEDVLVEIAYLIKKKKGYWIENQSRINFTNNFEEANATAIEVLNQIKPGFIK